jgi:hypothetical protein
MTKEQILEIVKKAMDSNLYTYTFVSEPCIYCELNGKDDMLKEIDEELDKLINANDLSKF